ncbi:MAG: XRE family transcriptional regulator [Bacteroidetes bacterium]|nr:MAG: XRE family transcriptional regulator [Bacteroidota bacterium]
MEKPEELRAFSRHRAEAYGPPGSLEHADFQSKAKTYRIGRTIRELRKAQNMTQAQLAERIGTQKSYISRIEKGADLQLTSLFKIFEHGLQTPVHLIAGDLIT